MTERTIQYEVTETAEETVEICDYCGLEADEDTVTLLPVEDTDAITQFDWDHPDEAAKVRQQLDKSDYGFVEMDDGYETLHYHGPCLRDALIEDGETKAVAWADLEDGDGSSVFLVASGQDVFVGAAGVIMLMASTAIAPTLPVIGPAVFISGAVLLGAGTLHAIKQANKPEDFLRRIQ